MFGKRALSLFAAAVVASSVVVGAGGVSAKTLADRSEMVAPRVVPSPNPQFAYTDSEKIHYYHQCCLRYIGGQSLKGLFCSSKELNYALGRGVIRIIAYRSGRKVCAPTGKPL